MVTWLFPSTICFIVACLDGYPSPELSLAVYDFVNKKIARDKTYYYLAISGKLASRLPSGTTLESGARKQPMQFTWLCKDYHMPSAVCV